MSKQLEFSPGHSANGADGFYLHVRRDDPDFIAAIHAAAVAQERPGLVKQIERFAAGRVPFAAAPAKPEPAEAEAPATATAKKHR